MQKLLSVTCWFVNFELPGLLVIEFLILFKVSLSGNNIIGFNVNCYSTGLNRIHNSFLLFKFFEASRGTGAQSVPVNRLVVGSIPTWGDDILIYIYILIFLLWCRGESAALSSATQHAMPSEIGRKWAAECFNIRFPLPTLLCAGYSVKLKKNVSYYWNENIVFFRFALYAACRSAGNLNYR